ncbi:hypothetical protein MDAP_000164 [Mitosporidium daphniae]
MLINTSRATDPVIAGTVIPGLVVSMVATAIIYSFADVSGAHFNPAVTMGFIISGKMHPVKGVAYILAQLSASIAAAAFMFLIFPNNVAGWPKIAQVIPAVPPKSSPLATVLMMEFYLTFLLVYVIFATAVDIPAPPALRRLKVSDGGAAGGKNVITLEEEESTNAVNEHEVTIQSSNSVASSTADMMESGSTSRRPYSVSKSVIGGALTARVYATPSPSKNHFAPIAIGLTLGFLCYLGGSSSGGAFNPARVFGASVISGNFSSHWVYWVGDLLGGSFAALLHTFVFARKIGILSP